jgi:aminopeptidase
VTRTAHGPAEPAISPETLDRYADLIVGLGANVQRGQIVELRAGIEHRPLVRAIAAAAYKRGARFVDVWWQDAGVRRARLEHAADDTIDFVAPWHSRRVLQLGEHRAARIAVSPSTTPGALDDLDPKRVGRDRYPLIPEYMTIINENTTNWTGVMGPTPGWAQLVHPELGREAALARLWEQLLHVCRLDEDDPLAAWHTRLDALRRAREALNERRFDALHYEGPGTDLTIGLLPSSTWDSGLSTTVAGIEHLANVPTEEVFTAPDPQRADGVVAATKPLVLKSGALVQGLRVRFEGGRAVSFEADSGAEAIRTMHAVDEGAARLGEVALVDREGRVGALDTVFYSTLLDENAASHFALGAAYLETVADEADKARANDSSVHTDFMVGADDVDVTGVTRDGTRVPVLRGGSWQI